MVRAGATRLDDGLTAVVTSLNSVGRILQPLILLLPSNRKGAKSGSTAFGHDTEPPL